MGIFLRQLFPITPMENISIMKLQPKDFGSISVSGQLPTYPSPNSTIVNWWQVTVNVGLGEGWVGSFPDTDIDPRFLPSHVFVKFASFSQFFQALLRLLGYKKDGRRSFPGWKLIKEDVLSFVTSVEKICFYAIGHLPVYSKKSSVACHSNLCSDWPLWSPCFWFEETQLNCSKSWPNYIQSMLCEQSFTSISAH